MALVFLPTPVSRKGAEGLRREAGSEGGLPMSPLMGSMVVLAEVFEVRGGRGVRSPCVLLPFSLAMTTEDKWN